MNSFSFFFCLILNILILILVYKKKESIENDEKQLIMEENKLNQVTITPKFTNLEKDQNNPHSLNEELDSDQI